MDWKDIAGTYRQRRTAGLSLNAMVGELQQRGVSLVDTTKVVRLTERMPLAEAYQSVISHPAWQAVRRARDILIGLRETMPKDTLALKLSGVLGVEFRMRDSDYYGGLYFTTWWSQQAEGSEEVYVFANLAPLGGPEYPEAADCPLLVEFRNPARTAAEARDLVARCAEIEARIVRD